MATKTVEYLVRRNPEMGLDGRPVPAPIFPAGVEPELVHVASETIAQVAPDMGPGLVGDKAHSMVFDCSKVAALVPAFRTTIEYHDAAHEQIAWFDANPSAQQVDAEQDAIFDRLVKGARAF